MREHHETNSFSHAPNLLGDFEHDQTNENSWDPFNSQTDTATTASTAFPQNTSTSSAWDPFTFETQPPTNDQSINSFGFPPNSAASKNDWDFTSMSNADSHPFPPFTANSTNKQTESTHASTQKQTEPSIFDLSMDATHQPPHPTLPPMLNISQAGTHMGAPFLHHGAATGMMPHNFFSSPGVKSIGGTSSQIDPRARALSNSSQFHSHPGHSIPGDLSSLLFCVQWFSFFI